MTKLALNTFSPDPAARKSKRRLGRGIGSGRGKTCGRGHKGQHSRSGGYHKVGFEGGQMPIQRRLPKFGFTSRKASLSVILRLHELEKAALLSNAEVVDLSVLKQVNLIRHDVQRVKVVLSGKLNRAVVIRGLGATAGARAAIEARGGQIIQA